MVLNNGIEWDFYDNPGGIERSLYVINPEYWWFCI